MNIDEIMLTDKVSVVEAIARICHEANRAYCEALGDYTQLPWDKADQWQRDSAISGVRFKLEFPTASCEDQHQAWVADKIRDGWKYGPVKDAEKKEHPCLVSYAELPYYQRIKDGIFVGIVQAFLETKRQSWAGQHLTI